MTRDEALKLLFMLSDNEDDITLNTMEAIMSRNETYVDDFMFCCARELLKVDRHGNGTSDDSMSLILDARRMCCS